jgi:hypothetical protein
MRDDNATEAVDAIVESLLAGESDQLKASVRLPAAEQLEIRMVPLTLVNALDESRTQASGWIGGASLATSIPVGIATDWLTDAEADPSTAAIVVLTVFATIAVTAWIMAAVTARRAWRQRRLLLSLTEED